MIMYNNKFNKLKSLKSNNNDNNTKCNNIKCKYCNSNKINKCGKQNNKQRYLCRDCRRTFIIEPDTRYKYDKYNLELRKLAITMYMNNVGIRSIERILKVSNVLILNWIKNIGKNIERINNNNDIEKKKNKKNINILEMDELYSYVKKNEIKLKYGLLLIETETEEIKTVMLNLK